MNDKNLPHDPKKEFLEEFEAEDKEIAKELLRLRQPASSALKHQVMAISETPNRQKKTSFLQRLIKPPLSWGLAVITLVIVIVAFPPTRSYAARVLFQVQQGMGSAFAWSANGAIILSPAPSFEVSQPAYLPRGFELTLIHYRSDSAALITENLVTRTNSNIVSSDLLFERLLRYSMNEPHVLLLYQAPDQQYILLFQRPVREGEVVSASASRSVSGHPARLTEFTGLRKLTWIADETRLELESTVGEAVLFRIAEQLVVTQNDDESEKDTADSGRISLCNREELLSQRHLLGSIPDQAYWGSVWISLFDREVNPYSVSYGIDTEGVTQSILAQRALDALEDRRLIGTTLSTPPISSLEFSQQQQCLTNSPNLLGFIVIEVWENQVKIGSTGRGDRIRQSAIDVLKQEIEENR